MSNFYTLLTRVGAALHANAQVNQTTVPWTHMRLGDGNGAAVVPAENQTGLVRQVHTLQITDIAVHPDNPNWVIAEAVVPSDVGGWTVRETAIYGGADGNTCIAVGNYPETYKPVLAEGAGREMVMRMVVEISSVATVKLQIDPAVAIASRAWVESLAATPAKAGLVKLASVIEHLAGEQAAKAATPQGVQAMLDAHRRPFSRSTGTTTLPVSAFGIYALYATDEATVTLPSLIDLQRDTELLLFAAHTNTAAVQVKAVTDQTIEGPAALMSTGATMFVLPGEGDWVLLRSNKAQGCWIVVATGYASEILQQREQIATLVANENSGSLQGNGWHRDGKTGLIRQWGSVLQTGSTPLTVPFPVPFPNACFVVHGSNASGANTATSAFDTFTKTSFRTFQMNLSSPTGVTTVRWEAIGW